MSWAKDEWKNNLTSAALQNVERLEKSLEALKKEKQQRIFQLESLEASLAVQKRKNEEEKGRFVNLQRELQGIAEKCEDLSKAREKLSQEIQFKDSRLNVVEGQLQSAKQLVENEKSKCGKLTTELEKEQADKLNLTIKLEKVTEERGKLIEMNNIQRQKLSSGGSSSEDTESLKVIADLEKKLKEAKEELKSMKEAGPEVMESKPFKANNDLMSFDASPDKQLDLMCFDEPPNACVSNKNEVNLLELDSEIPAANMEQLPAVENRLDDLNRLLEKTKQDLRQTETDLKTKDRELVQLTSKFDKESTNNENLLKKVQQLTKELDCQRHNFEAAKEHQEERFKEKERQSREEMASQRDFIKSLEKEFNELQQKSQHEIHCAKNKETEVTSQLSKLQHELELLSHANADVAAERKEMNAALMSSEKEVIELGRETKALINQKDSMMNELESVHTKAKKFEVEIGILKGDLTSKDNIVKQLDSELKSSIAQNEKFKHSSQKDVNNLKAEADRARKDSMRLESEKSVTSEKLQRAELFIRDLEGKIRELEGSLVTLKKDASVKDRELDVKRREEESLKRVIEQSKEHVQSKDEEIKTLLKAQEDMKRQMIDAERSHSNALVESQELAKNYKELCVKLDASVDELQCKKQEIGKMQAEIKEEVEKVRRSIDAGWIQKFSDCDMKRAALEAECDDLRRSMESMKNVKNSVEVEKNEMLLTLDRIELDNAKVTEENAVLNKRVFEMEKFEEDAKIMVQKLQSERDGVSENIKQISQEKDHFKNLNLEMEERLAELVSSKDAALSKLESVKRESKNWLTEKERVAVENEDLVRERTISLEKIAQLEEACLRMKIDTEKALGQTEELKVKKNELEKEFTALKEDLMNLKSGKVEMESLASERDRQIEALLHEKQKSTENYDIVVSERDGFQIEMDRLLIKLSDIQEVKENAALKISQYEKEKQEDLENLTKLKAEVLLFEEERNGLKENVIALRASLEGKELELKQNEDDKGNVKRKLEELTYNLECSRKEKERVEEGLMGTINQYLENEQVNDDLKVELDSALLELAQIKEEHLSLNNETSQKHEAEIKSKEEVINKLNAQLEMLQMDLEDQRECFEENMKAMECLEAEKKTIDERLKCANEALKRYEMMNAELEELCMEKQRTVSNLQSKVEQSQALESRLERAAVDVETLEQQQSLAESMLQQKDGLLTEKEKEIENLRKNLDFYDQSLMHKSEELGKVNRKWEEVESQVRELSEEKESILVEKNCSINQLTKERDSLAENWQQIVKERDNFKNLKHDLEKQLSDLLLSRNTAVTELEFANGKYDELLNENDKVKMGNSELLREQEINLEKIKQLEEKSEQLQNSIDKSLRDSADQQLGVDALKQEASSLKDEHAATKRRIAELEYLMEVIIQEKAETMEDIQKAVSERNAIKTEFDEMRLKMASNMQILKEENESRLDCVIQEKQEILETLVKVQNESKAVSEEKELLTNAITKLESSVEEKNSQILEMGEEEATIKMKLKEAEGELRCLQGHLDLKEKEIQDLKEFVRATKDEAEVLFAAKEDLLLITANLNTEVEDLVQSKAVLSTEIVDYQNAVVLANEEISDLKQANDSAEDQLKVFENDKAELEIKRQSLIEENENLRNSLSSLSEDASVMRTELMAVKEQLNSLQEDSKIKEEFINKLTLEIEVEKKERSDQCDLLAQKDKEVNILIYEKESLNEKLTEFSCSLKLKSDEIQTLERQKEELVNTLNSRASDLEELKYKLEEKESELETYKEQKCLADGLLRVKIELLDEREKEVEELKRNLSDYDENLILKVKELERLERKYEEKELNLNDVIKEKIMLISKGKEMLKNKDDAIQELEEDRMRYLEQVEILTESQKLKEKELFTSAEKLSELDDVIGNLAKEKELLQSDLHSAQKEIAVKIDILSRQEEEISSQSDVIKECQSLAKSFKNEIEHLQSEIARINAGVEVKDRDNSKLCLKVAEFESNVIEKDLTIQRLNEEKEVLEKESSEKASKLLGDIVAKQDEVQELMDCFSKKEEECKRLLEENELKTKEISTIREEVKMKNDLLAEKDENVSCLKGEINEMKDCLSKKGEECRLLIKQNELQAEEIATICEEVEVKIALLSEKENSISCLKNEISEMRDCLNEKVEECRLLFEKSELKAKKISTICEEVEMKKVLLAEKENNVNCLKDELNELKDCFSKKEEEYNVLLEENELKTKEISAICDEVEMKTALLTEKEENVSSLKEEVNDLKDSLSKKEEEYKILFEKGELQTEEMSTICEEVRTKEILLKERDDCIDCVKDEMSELKDRLIKKEKEYELLLEENGLKTNEISTICEEIEMKTALLTEKENSINSLKEEFAELNKKSIASESLLSCNADDIRLLKVEVEDLIKQCDEKDESYQTLTAEKNCLNQTVSRLDHKVEMLEKEKIQLRKEVEDFRDVAAESEKQLGSLNEEIRVLKASLSDRDEKISLKNNEIDSHQESLKCKDDTIFLKEEEIQSIRNSLKDLELQLSEKNKQIDSITKLSQDQESDISLKNQEIVSIRTESEKKLFDKHEEVKSLQMIVKRFEDEISKREKEASNCQKSLEDQEMRVLERDQTIESNLRELGALKQEISAKDNEMAIVKEHISKTEAQCTMFEKQLLEYKENIDTYLHTIEDLRSEANEKDIRLMELDSKVEFEVKKNADEAEKSKSEYEKLVNILVEKDSEIGNLRSEGRKTRSNQAKRISDLEKVLANKEDELKQNISKIEKLELDLGSHKFDHDALFNTMADDVRRLTDKVDTLEVTNGKLDKELWERNAELENLTQENVALEGEKKLLLGRVEELDKEKNNLKEEYTVSLKARDDKIKKYVTYVSEMQGKMEKYRRHSREAKRSSSGAAPNEQSAVRQGIKNMQLETPNAHAVTPKMEGETPIKRTKLSQDGPSEKVKKSRVLTVKTSLPQQASPIASRTRRKICNKESPQRRKPYPKSKPESISDASESESENQNQAKENTDIKEKRPERLRSDSRKRVPLSPAKGSQVQNQASKFRSSRLASSAKYDFEKDFAKEISKEEKKRTVKLKSLRDLDSDKYQADDPQQCPVQ